MAERFRIGTGPLRRGARDPGVRKVQDFLTKFGYLTEPVTPGRLDKSTSEALASFQRALGLRPTGALDDETIDLIEKPRCGTPDTPLIQALERAPEGAVAEFTLRGCSYSSRVLTYRFVNGTDDVAGDAERAAVRDAFATWAGVLCGVAFEERQSGPADFEIAWATGDHGDGSAFDGVGNTLAHAFYPPPCGGGHAGKLHFDDAETWSLTGSGGTFDVETVALHEVGHLLGLGHSSVAGSVMFPTYGGVRRSLTQDDVDGIRRLYPSMCRRGDSGDQAGFVGEIAAARHRDRQVVTAVQTQAGTLKLIAWSVASDGGVTRTGDSGDQAGKASSIALARNANGEEWVTAVRTSAGDLKLLSWRVDAAGTSIQRAGDSGAAAGRASLIAIVPLREDRFVTALRAGDGRLMLIGWRLDADGSLKRLADSGSAAGEAREIALVRLTNDRVATAVRSASGDLKLISWRVTDGSVSRLADSGNAAGNARVVRAVVDGHGHVVTAVKAADDSLKLITWSVDSAGAISRLADSGSEAGETRGHAVTAAGGRVVTAVRTAADNLKVIAWETASDGTVKRIGDSADQAGTIGLVALPEGLAGAPPVATCVRTEASTLKLITWDLP